jgi:DNA-binding MarR family transcriptional regulator
VATGALKRDASQADGRRSLLVSTEFGDSLQAEIRSVKRMLLARAFENWQARELQDFAVLFDKFVASFEAVYATTDSLSVGKISDGS